MRGLPRVDKVADGKFLGKIVGDALGVDHQVVVQITAVGVDEAHLLRRRGHYVGMTVADVGHVIDAVQVAIVLLAEHVLALATHDFDWVLLEEQRDRGTVINKLLVLGSFEKKNKSELPNMFLAQFDGFIFGHLLQTGPHLARLVELRFHC